MKPSSDAGLRLVRNADGKSRWTFDDSPPKARMSPTLRANAAAAVQADPDKFWWFITDDSVAAIADDLRSRSYCIIDGLVGPRTCEQLLAGCKTCRANNLLGDAQLGGTRGKDAQTFSHAAARNDSVGWFQSGSSSDGALEAGTHRTDGLWAAGVIEKLTCRVDTLVQELKPLLPSDLGRVGSRAPLQVACYPGGGARYVRHCDNTCNRGNGPLCNGRRLTAVFYPNRAWAANDGGELRVWPTESVTGGGSAASVTNDANGRSSGSGGSSSHGGGSGSGSSTEPPPLADVEPLADRLILFFADLRVPHEVLPSFAERYAITLWYFDSQERQAALAKEKDSFTVNEYIESSEKQHGGQAAVAAKGAG